MMKRISLWITLGLGALPTHSFADFAYHFDFWSRQNTLVYGADDQKVGAGNQCVIYSKIIYEYDGMHELPFIQGLKDGEVVANLDWNFGAKRNYRVSKVDSWGQARWTDNIDELFYLWWENVDGYALSKGCSLKLTTEDNFQGAKEIVLPRPQDDQVFTGNEKLSELNLIFPVQNAYHPTKEKVKSIACACKDKVPSPILPEEAAVEAVKARVKEGSVILREVEKSAQDLTANLNLTKTRLQTFKERYEASGISDAILAKVSDTTSVVSPDELLRYETTFRSFSNQNCSSNLIKESFESLATLDGKGDRLIEKFKLEYADAQDGSNAFVTANKAFSAARRSWKAERSAVTQSYNAYLRACQITGSILQGIPQRIRFEKLNKQSAAFKAIADSAIEAIDDANRALKQYSVKLYWDAEFIKRLNELSALRINSYLAKVDAFSIELAEWYLQFRESIKADPSMTEADATTLLAQYDKQLRDEKKLFADKRAFGAKVLVSSRIENRFNTDLLLKIRKQIHASPAELKQSLATYYASVVQNAGFGLPSDCEQANTAVRNAACWKLKVDSTFGNEEFEVYDPKLDVLEEALRTKFAL